MIAAKVLPVSEYILQIEKVCQQLEQGKAEELRVEVKQIFKKTQPPKPNITKEEAKAIQELKRDKERVILTADKGVSMVVMDKEEYIHKSEELLHQPSYKQLPSDPTTKHKNRLISILKTIKLEWGIDNISYKRLYPTGAGAPKYYGLPKIHKQGVPHRPIISSRGSAAYESAKELAKILKPQVRKSPHHVQNNKDFLDSIKDIKIKQEECIMSYDVSALFTSIPREPAINIIEKQLKEDKDLHSRTNMKIHHIISLLRFCLDNSYFSFQGRFYQQTEGAAMGSPISPIVANLFMEDLEVQAIRTSPTPPSLWKRYVDDTFTVIKKEDRSSFLQHLNSIHQNIKFTCEDVRDDGSMPFLDILVTPKEDGSLSTSVFRKPTHTDLYLQWNSHHTISTKYSVAGTRYHRAKTICSEPQLQKEEDHLCQALQKCMYPIWAINRARIKSQNPVRRPNRNNNNQTGQKKTTNKNIYMVVPYQQGLSERFKNIKDLLMAPKDKDPITNNSGVIYRFKCSGDGCEEEYIGESARTFAERFKEHQKSPSPIHDHSNISGHKVDLNNFTITGREDQTLTRAIKEALFIRVNDPSPNRNIGKYHLPHI